MDNITYRKMENADIETVTRLRISQLNEEGGRADFDLSVSLRGFYKRCLADGSYISWLAIKDDEIIATSGISFTEKPPYYSNPTGKIGLLSSMYTVPAHRRQGIAKRLLRFIVDEAKMHGCGSIHITASDVGVCLYEDFGFVRNENFLFYNIV